MNLGFSSGFALFDGAGLIGFALWLAFITTTSIWLLRHRTPVGKEPFEPSMQEV